MVLVVGFVSLSESAAIRYVVRGTTAPGGRTAPPGGPRLFPEEGLPGGKNVGTILRSLGRWSLGRKGEEPRPRKFFIFVPKEMLLVRR